MLVIQVGEQLAPRPRIEFLMYSPDSRQLGVVTHRKWRTARSWYWEFKVWVAGTAGDVIEVRSARSLGWDFHRPPFTFDELMTKTYSPVPRFTTPTKPGKRRLALRVAKAADEDTFAQLAQYYDPQWRARPIYAALVRPAGCATTNTLAEWAPSTKGGEKIILNPAGTQVALLIGRVIHVWSVETGHELVELKLGRLRPEDIAFSADGKTLAVVVQDRVCFYNTVGWKESRGYSWQVGKLRTVAFAPDGTTAAVGSDVGEVVVFDLE